MCGIIMLGTNGATWFNTAVLVTWYLLTPKLSFLVSLLFIVVSQDFDPRTGAYCAALTALNPQFVTSYQIGHQSSVFWNTLRANELVKHEVKLFKVWSSGLLQHAKFSIRQRCGGWAFERVHWT